MNYLMAELAVSDRDKSRFISSKSNEWENHDLNNLDEDLINYDNH